MSGMAFDTEWWRQQKEDDLFTPTRVQKLMLGSGHTIATLAHDGYGKVIKAKIPLSNGDFVLVHVWEWYNK
jgi:translation initiation factor IF-1